MFFLQLFVSFVEASTLVNDLLSLFFTYQMIDKKN
jgi:hypothetical protein